MAVYDSKYNGAELDDAIDDALSHIQDKSNPHNVTKSQVGLGNVGNFKAVSTEANQGLTETEKTNARNNLGLGSMATKSSLTENDIPSIPKSKISDFPTSMPASDVPAWAKESTKPTYTASEVGACANNDSRLSDARVASNIKTSLLSKSSNYSITSDDTFVLAEYLRLGNTPCSLTIVVKNTSSTDIAVTVPTSFYWTSQSYGADVKTPDGQQMILTCPAGGYCEVNFAYFVGWGYNLYARGI